jgi:mannose-6-phosphate isomerase
MTPPSEAVLSRVKGALDRAGLSVASEDLARPWGGFLTISHTDVAAFVDAYFADSGLEIDTQQATLSPKVLIVAPGQRLSWQYHLRRSEIWRVIEGPIGISRSSSEDEGPLLTCRVGELLRIDVGEHPSLGGTHHVGDRR